MKFTTQMPQLPLLVFAFSLSSFVLVNLEFTVSAAIAAPTCQGIELLDIEEAEAGLATMDGVVNASGEGEISSFLDDDRDIIERLPLLFSGDAPESVEDLIAMENHFAELYEKVESSVVNIRAGQGQGSGVVVSSDGYILTAAHVIGRPNIDVLIEFTDGRRARARTLGMERDLDSGMLKITSMIEPAKMADESETDESDEDSDEDSDDGEEEDEGDEESNDDEAEDDDDKGKSDDDESEDEDEDDEDDDADKESEDDSDESESDNRPLNREMVIDEDLPSFDYLDLGLSSELNRGQWVMAIGHPGGINPKRGLVMRVGRILSMDPGKLQTDCTLVGGDSGGPLIDMAGNVVGIHSRIGSNLTDNLHVPADVFSKKWERLELGYVLDRTPTLGFTVKGDTTVVQAVMRKRAAVAAGMQRGDKVLQIGDTEVSDKKELASAISKLRPFDRVKIVIERKGKKRTLIAKVEERKR